MNTRLPLTVVWPAAESSAEATPWAVRPTWALQRRFRPDSEASPGIEPSTSTRHCGDTCAGKPMHIVASITSPTGA